MSNLFNIAYFIGKEWKPLSDMEKQCKLAKKLGVDSGNNYHNDLSAKQFLGATSKNLQQDASNEVKRANFISIFVNGNTDISVMEKELVYVRNINALGQADTVLASIVSPEHSHALGVFEAIKSALHDFGIEFEDLKYDKPGPSLICANFDGASAMQGHKSCVIAHIRQEVPEVIPMHCIAHKLELAILDSVKSIPFLKKYEGTWCCCWGNWGGHLQIFWSQKGFCIY